MKLIIAARDVVAAYPQLESGHFGPRTKGAADWRESFRNDLRRAARRNRRFYWIAIALLAAAAVAVVVAAFYGQAWAAAGTSATASLLIWRMLVAIRELDRVDALIEACRYGDAAIRMALLIYDGEHQRRQWANPDADEGAGDEAATAEPERRAVEARVAEESDAAADESPAVPRRTQRKQVERRQR